MKGDLERERDRDRRRLRYGERERDLDRLLERDPLEGERDDLRLLYLGDLLRERDLESDLDRERDLEWLRLLERLLE